MTGLILASTSPYKKQLFQRLGLEFTVCAPNFHERIIPEKSPADLALLLAEGKAGSLFTKYPDSFIVGADQVLALGDRVFSKPGSAECAVKQLKELMGRTHHLFTAYAILNAQTGESKTRVVHSRLRMRTIFDQRLLHRLVNQDRAWDCVGGYKFESLGIQLFSSIRTSDPNAIVGLPLLTLGHDLRHLIKGMN